MSRSEGGEPGRNTPEVRVNVLLAHAPSGDLACLRGFAERAAEDARPALEEATGATWTFRVGEPTQLRSDRPHGAAEFLNRALLRMVETPADLVLVVTETQLASRAGRLVPGLASPEARVAVLSARRFATAPFREPVRPLDDEAVRWNAAALLVHLAGHAFGLKHEPVEVSGAMAPFRFEDERRRVPRFGDAASRKFARQVRRMPEREIHVTGVRGQVAAHLRAALREPRRVLAPALRTPSLLVPFEVSGFAVGALSPIFVFMFTDEVWLYGIRIAWLPLLAFLGLALLLGTLHLATRLAYPHRERQTLTPSVALVNVAIAVSSFLLILSLFLLAFAAFFAYEVFFFPPGYLESWFNDPQVRTVTLVDKARLAAFVGTLGTLIGSLAGSIKGPRIVEAFALFLKEP